MNETGVDKKQNLVQSIVKSILSNKKYGFLFGASPKKIKETPASIINLDLTQQIVAQNIETTKDAVNKTSTIDFSQKLQTPLVNVLTAVGSDKPINDTYVEPHDLQADVKNDLNRKYACDWETINALINKSISNPNAFYIHQGHLIVGGQIIGNYYGQLQNASNIAVLLEEIKTLKEKISELEQNVITPSKMSSNTTNTSYLWVGSSSDYDDIQKTMGDTDEVKQTVFMTVEE